MFVDMRGKTRIKVGLHLHTTRSDGEKTPEEAASIYAAAGYDAIALTDHWIYGEPGTQSGLTVLSGCEYNLGGIDGAHVVHIVGVGMEYAPDLPRLWDRTTEGSHANAATVVRSIKEAGGLAIAAHPAWSLNTPEQLLSLGDFDLLEIYNAVSECGMSDRAYSDVIADQLATAGRFPGLIATDDVHYYRDDACRGWIMVEAENTQKQTLIDAIRSGKFYATQGPEVHIEKIAPDRVRVVCSPAAKIVFMSNTCWAAGRVVRGEDLTEAEYTRAATDRFVRAEITDIHGNKAWTNYIIFD
jgi:predicted metal-dependent phosphoesterase TrpH